MMAAVLVPWAVRNSQVFGQTVLISTNGGATLLTGNNPSADGSYIENDPLVAQRNFSVRDQVEADRRAKELALNWIKENPGRFIQLIPLKIWHLWAKDGEIEWGYQSEYPHYQEHRRIFRSVRWINQIFYSLLLAGSLGAAVLLIKNGRGGDLAVGALRLLFDNLPDADIDGIFRAVAVSFSRDAMDYHVRILGSRHVFEVRRAEAIEDLMTPDVTRLRNKCCD